MTAALRLLLPPPGSDEVALAVDRFLPVTVALLARAITVRAERLMISVEMRLR